MCSSHSLWILNLVLFTFPSLFCFVSCNFSFFDWIDEKGKIIISYDTQHQYDDYMRSNLSSTDVPHSSWINETFICFNTPLNECLSQTREDNKRQQNNGKQQQNDQYVEKRVIRHLFTDSFAVKNVTDFDRVFTEDLKLLLFLVYEKLDFRNLVGLFQNAKKLETLLYFTNTTETDIEIPENYTYGFTRMESSLEHLYLCGTFNPSTASLIKILQPKFLSTRYLESEFDIAKLGHLPSIFTEIELGRFIKYSPDFFTYLLWHNVEKLGMANSFLKDIPPELTLLEDTLHYLSLALNDLSSIDDDEIFPQLSNLWELDLRFCGLKSLNDKFFNRLPQLKSVSLAGNFLLQSNYQGNLNFIRNNFIYFDLSLNPFSKIFTSVKYSSSELRRHFNYSETNDDGLFLDLSYTDFKKCHLDLEYIKTNITHLAIINSKRCFRSVDFPRFVKNLEAIDASFNIDEAMATHSIAETIKSIFQRTLNVRVLLFRGNNLYRGLSAKPELFDRNFTALEVLHLGGNELKSIPYHLFQINTLKILNLSSNSITTWNKPLVGNDRAHLKVDLSSNRISCITEAMQQDFFKFEEVNLKDNVLQCNEQLWRLLCACETRNESVKIVNMEETTCFYEDFERNVTLAHFRNSKKCEPFPDGNLPGAGKFEVICYSGTILVSLFLYVTWNWTKFFDHMNGHNYSVTKTIQSLAGLSPLAKSNDFEFLYDVFVSYAEIDRDWVVDKLMPNLESEPGMRICVHERDFQIGVGILENIVECIDKSRCLLLVISKSFVKSKWCQFEMNLGQHFTVESNKPNLVLVLLEEIPHSMRPKVLNFLMRTRTYIEWPKCAELNIETEFFKRLTKALNSFKV